jgi:hypothetical protein
MDAVGILLIALGVAGIIFYLVARGRRRSEEIRAEMSEEGRVAGAGTLDPFSAEIGQRARVAGFHVKGTEAEVTFDVPLPEGGDQVLTDLLMDEAVEVVREKRHTLPIDDVTHIVVYAGGDDRKLIGRTKLPSPGELPPPGPGLDFTQIARDPFAHRFESATDHSVTYETKTDVPADELGPIRAELRIPGGLERGLRATGVDPDELEATEFILSLLRMFGYSVTELPQPDSYLASKDGRTTFLRTDPYRPGDHPELSEAAIRRFLADYGSSGAERGMLISGKYAPFMVHEIESRQPKVRFITRERVQGFIDSMALG